MKKKYILQKEKQKKCSACSGSGYYDFTNSPVCSPHTSPNPANVESVKLNSAQAEQMQEQVAEQRQLGKRRGGHR